MIAERLEQLREAIAQYAREAGRAPQEIRLIGVCKFQPIEKIVAALDAGLTDLGQNYVQEIAKQASGLGKHFSRAHWHFVGGLQRNKVKDLLRLFPGATPLIHTLDRPSLARALEQGAASSEKTVSCLVQVLPEADLTNEERVGCPAEEIVALLKFVRDCPHIAVRGLMILPPLTETTEQARRHFHFLRELGRSLQREVESLSCERISLQEYSMGMTADLREAIIEGATYVRVGTGLFGEREKKA